MTKKFTQIQPSPSISMKNHKKAFRIAESDHSNKLPNNSVALANQKLKCLEEFSIPNFVITDFNTRRALQDYDQI